MGEDGDYTVYSISNATLSQHVGGRGVGGFRWGWGGGLAG